MNPYILRWVCGIMVGAFWTWANFWSILGIAKVGMLKSSKSKLTALLLIKFPVLYLAGFLILSSRLFPVYSLLAGSACFLLIMGAYRICPKRIR
jgi:hypothetical protein